jgi:hypothetical protein
MPPAITGLLLSTVLLATGPADRPALDSLRQDIALINLLVGLELTPSQADSLAALDCDAAVARDRFDREVAALGAEAAAALAELRANRLSGQEVPDWLGVRVHSLEQQVELAAQSRDRDLAAIGTQVAGLLSDHQRTALSAYRPCLVPPKGQSSIGQAGSHGPVVAMFERVRGMTAAEYAAERSAIVVRSLDKERRHLPAPASLDAAVESTRLGALLDRVRSLSGTDYQLRCDALATEFTSTLDHALPQPTLAGQIERWLLDPRVPGLLTEIRQRPR